VSDEVCSLLGRYMRFPSSGSLFPCGEDTQNLFSRPHSLFFPRPVDIVPPFPQDGDAVSFSPFTARRRAGVLFSFSLQELTHFPSFGVQECGLPSLFPPCQGRSCFFFITSTRSKRSYRLFSSLTARRESFFPWVKKSSFFDVVVRRPFQRFELSP